ncbi:PKD domain-containing protein [Methanoregula boonei]|nr:PKD domain-containing protein [Methanoregula boonei]
MLLFIIGLIAIAILPGISSAALKDTSTGTIYQTLEDAATANTGSDILFLISNTSVTLTPGKNIVQFPNTITIQQNKTYTGGKTDKDFIFVNATIGFNGNSQTYTLSPTGSSHFLIFSYDQTGTFQNNSLFEITGNSNTFNLGESHPSLIAGSFTGTGVNLTGNYNSLNSWIGELEDANGDGYASDLSIVFNLAGSYNSISDTQSCPLNTQASGGIGLKVTGNFNGAPGSASVTSPPTSGETSPPIYIDTSQIYSAPGGKIYIAPSANGNVIRDDNFNLNTQPQIYLSNGTAGTQTTSWYFFNSSWSPSGGNRNLTIDTSQWSFPFGGNVSLVAGISNITGQSTDIIQNSSLFLDSTTGESSGILKNDTSSLKFNTISAVVPVGMSIGNNTYLDKNNNIVSTPGSLGYVTVLDFNPYYSLPNENFNSTRTTDWSSIPDFTAAHNLTLVVENKTSHALLGNISYNQDLDLLTSGVDSGLAVLGNNLAISSTGNSTNFTMTNAELNSVFNNPATLTMYPNNFPFAGYGNITITATTDSGTTTTLFDKGTWLNYAGFVNYPSQNVTVIGNSSISLPVLHFSKYDFFETAPVANFTGTPTNGNAPLTVQFTDTSAYSNPDSWNWSFGDGNFSVAQNPAHTYVSAGSYTVSLTSADVGGSNTTTIANYINVSAALPVPIFTGTPTSGAEPLNVQFNDTTPGTGIQYWNWSFGDTTWSNTTDVTAKNVTHLYTAIGSYTVSLSVTNSSGISSPATVTNTTTIANYINISAALPIPIFTGTPTSGPEPLSVQFNDTTPGAGIQYWNWSFGDATWFNTTDVTAKNVTHPYSSAGSYTVNLSVTNSSGLSFPATITNTTTIANYINVSAALPVPIFTGTPTSGAEPLSVQFNDTTPGTGIQYWNWSFGDGNWFNTTDVTAKNVTHPYTAIGSYTVSLSVTNSSGIISPATVTNTTTIANYINVSAALPIPIFTGTPTSGFEPLSVQFNDTTPGTGIRYWNWSFGDATWFNTTDVTAKNVTHPYSSAGSFSVSLSVTNSSGLSSPATITNTTKLANYINASATLPIPVFTGTPTFGHEPQNVQFNDSTSGTGIQYWNWSFGDGNWFNTTDVTAKNVTHPYTAIGSYTVSLSVTNSSGILSPATVTNTTSIANYINISAALPIPVFTGNPTSGHAPLSVLFNDSTSGTGIQYWNWSFGDTTWSNTTDVTAKNVTHLYLSAGSYTVNLSVTNSSGLSSPATITNTTSILNYISITGPLPVPSFTGSPRGGNATLVVQFNDTSISPGITAWNWSFGDSGWSNTTNVLLRNATHQYSVQGSYTVNLSVTNSSGSNTTSQTGYIVVGPPLPIPDFTGSPTHGNPPLAVQFNDTSTSPGINSWNWSFGDNIWFNTTDITVRNASHTYSSTGTFTVNLTVTNTTGVNTTSRSGYISTLPSLPIPAFTGSPVSGLAPLFVQFTDTSTSPGINSWNWSFGDGSWFNTSDATQRNANYTYVNAGSYTVSLSVSNTSGTNTTTRNGFITATSSSSSAPASPGSSGVSSSVGGSTAVTLSSVPSGQTAIFSFDQNPNPVQPVAVIQVQVVPSQNLGTVEVIALPATIGKPLEGTVAGYILINLVGVNPDAVDHGVITFSVIEEWLGNHQVNPANIVLMREHNNQWTALPTTFDHQDGDYYYFDATTPGFSYFAVVAQSPGTTPGATVKSTPAPAITPITPVVTTVPTYAIVQRTPIVSPVTVGTTAVPATSAPSTSSGIPINVFAAIGGIVIVLGGILLIRRWWIRRQNPALFRKYD